MLISSHGYDVDGLMMNVQNTTISSTERMKVLGVKVDNKLNFTEHISDLCIKALRQLSILQRFKGFLTTNSYGHLQIIYEVRDLFPWEMLTKMATSCLLSVEKIWNSTQINLSSILNFYRKQVLKTIISTEKSTSEINADLAQNEM